jgi:DNA polymerase-3 subunit gamma/tau
VLEQGLQLAEVDADSDALAVIARAAAGSARDALSLLDQALAHDTGRVDADAVRELFGRTPFDVRGRVLEAVAAEDAPLVLTSLQELLDAGHEPRRVAEDLLRAARDAFLITAGGGQVPLDVPPDEQERLRELGRVLGNTTLVRVLETLGQAVVDMRGTDAADPRLVLEIALVRLTRRDAGPPLQTVIERIERLERSVAALGQSDAATGSNPSPAPAPAPGRTIGAIRRETPPDASRAATEGSLPSERTSEDQAPDSSEVAPPAKSEREEPAEPFQLDDVIVAWAAILPELPVATRSAVQEAQPLSVEDDVITFGVPPSLFEAARPRFHRERETIRGALSERLGRTARFTLISHEGFAAGGGPSNSVASNPPSAVAREPDDDGAEDPAIDPAELIDAEGDDRSDDSMRILTDTLGATVVEERPRE